MQHRNKFENIGSHLIWKSERKFNFITTWHISGYGMNKIIKNVLKNCEGLLSSSNRGSDPQLVFHSVLPLKLTTFNCFHFPNGQPVSLLVINWILYHQWQSIIWTTINNNPNWSIWLYFDIEWTKPPKSKLQCDKIAKSNARN